ncbi:MAG: hypothetical protein XE05_2041 [Thermotogales bacterium 46_20]|nr:MAG: hypothetical protein XE05_2041 [Thermotogales bacterium 46_20]
MARAIRDVVGCAEEDTRSEREGEMRIYPRTTRRMIVKKARDHFEMGER